jgi:hypothetical protein
MIAKRANNGQLIPGLFTTESAETEEKGKGSRI